MKKNTFAAMLLLLALLCSMSACGDKNVSQQNMTENAETSAPTENNGYSCPDFKSREEGAEALRSLIESVPRGYRSVYDYDSQEDFNLIQREISGKYEKLSLDDIRAYYVRTLTAIDALSVRYSDVPQIFITTGDVGWEYTSAKIAITGDGSIVNDTVGTSEYFSTADALIKLRGNSSSSVDKKSYTLKFDERTSLLGMDYGKKWTLLANPFDKTLMRIKLCFDYAAALGLPYSSQTSFADVWLNGVYMGVYVLIEPVSEGRGRVDISSEDGDFIIEKNNVREEGGVRYLTTGSGLRFEINEPSGTTEEQLTDYKNLLDSAESALFTLDHTQYEQYFDLESFVNFYIFEEMIKDVDFAEYSTRYFVKDGKLYAGPPWDCDLTMGNVSYCEPKYLTYNNSDGMGDGSENSTQVFWARRDWHEWLCRDSYFM
ncbi:MAG: CotH kinase family protein, partial [Eubacteriales bacterium]